MELKEKFRYKIEILSSSADALLLVLPAIAIILFGDFHIEGIENRSDYFKYIIFSLIVWQLVENMWSAVFEIRRKLKEGNLEYMMSLPLNGIHYLIGWSVRGFCSALLEMLPLIVIYVIFAEQAISLEVVVQSAYIIVVMLIGTYGFAEILMGLGIYFKEADQIVSLISNMAPFLAGLYFPMNMLPKVFLPLSCLLPFSWGMDLMRSILFHTSTVISITKEMLVFTVICLLFLMGGVELYNILMKKARKGSMVRF
jgi:ABC-2 type transport system permease protein